MREQLVAAVKAHAQGEIAKHKAINLNLPILGQKLFILIENNYAITL